mmetsp:Transcript_30534/g.71294  ORF Transcript_30534/g.71294 Transcript_30534/m.71294 type:complete len:103 (-) Transcript_30534:2-310(-)
MNSAPSLTSCNNRGNTAANYETWRSGNQTTHERTNGCTGNYVPVARHFDLIDNGSRRQWLEEMSLLLRSVPICHQPDPSVSSYSNVLPQQLSLPYEFGFLKA